MRNNNFIIIIKQKIEIYKVCVFNTIYNVNIIRTK